MPTARLLKACLQVERDGRQIAYCGLNMQFPLRVRRSRGSQQTSANALAVAARQHRERADRGARVLRIQFERYGADDSAVLPGREVLRILALQIAQGAQQGWKVRRPNQLRLLRVGGLLERVQFLRNGAVAMVNISDLEGVADRQALSLSPETDS